jgi:NADH-quinone oxidoreductase subunit E
VNKYFTPEIKAKADTITVRYEVRRAAMLEILHLMQETYGYISLEIEQAVAEYMQVSDVAVREVVTFYTLYYQQPKAKTRFNVCRTLPCMLAGGDTILKYFEEKLGLKPGHCTKDGQFGLQTVECLGACELAPMLQFNDEEYVGWLTQEKVDAMIKSRTAPKDSVPVAPVK